MIPPLPPAWPYAPRTPGPAFATREDTRLPGLEGAWTLVAPPGLVLDAAPGELGGAYGRGGVFRRGDLVLRPYRRGGLMRLVNERVYLGPERFQGELDAHLALWNAGFPTVEPLGYAFRPRLWGCEGVFITRFAEGTPWPRAWQAEALPQVKEIIGALCAWGLYAPDLNATNFLVTPDGRTLALDWDRAEWIPGVPLEDRYRTRLARSCAKLGAPGSLVI